ncbi:MAG: glycine oxidase ThiO [Polyangiaceae bacterium]|nr:glycine oxidase ThiO [Polyangiaceae bacterium]
MTDILVIGAGVIGCASALALARRGASVTLVERIAPSHSARAASDPATWGDAASWAAAGIVGAQSEVDEDGPMARLCLASRERYPGWAGVLAETTGIDIGLRRCGAMRVSLDPGEASSVAREAAWQVAARLPVEHHDGPAARAAEPALSDEVAGAVRYPEDGRIDPPALMRSLRVAAARAGARFRGGAPARRLMIESGRACGAILEDGAVITAARVVLAAGAWSSQLECSGLPRSAVRPARGQIVELATEAPPLTHVVFGPACYMSPRDDGRILIGSTTEFVGFTPGVTARAVADLMAAAIRLVPSLAEAAVSRAWSGLRPHTRDELPILGEGEIRDLIYATGHFRNGILLAPITAEIVAALSAGRAPPVDLAPFNPARLAAPAA